MPGLVDIIMGYDCNVACTYCTITPQMRTRALSAAGIAAALRGARADGFDRAAFTGGEPTIRPDLLGQLRLAKRLGFGSIKVQTNGLLLSTAANAQRLLDAGVTEVHISIHTHDAAAYEAMVRREGTHALMAKSVELFAARAPMFVADVILERDTVERLPAAIEWLQGLGVAAVDLWYVSLTDANASRPQSLPSMSRVVDAIGRARAVAPQMRLRSLHLPRCVLGEHADLAWNPAAQRVRVVSPDAIFDLSASALTPQLHVPACEGCSHREACPGLRADYLEQFGDVEIAAARGQTSTRGGARSLPVL